jgi:hypothetical protein
VNPGPLTIIRDDHVHNSPNHVLRAFRRDAAHEIRRAHLDPDTHDTIWALVLTADDWAGVPPWVRLALGLS